MSRKAVISTAVAPIYKEASFSSAMVTQALMWETVEVFKEENLWFYIQQADGYKGWIYTFYLSKNVESYSKWITLTNRFTPVINKLDKNKEDRLLSFGTRVPVIKEDTKGITIALPNGQLGNIPAQKLFTIKSREQLIKLAKSLMGTPYIWGGKSAYGFDCSGFVQLVLGSIEISIARDTGLQVKSSWLKKISINESMSGDLVFFAENEQINHVGFSLGEGKIIHCSGEVKIESIIEGEEAFNQYLSQTIYKTLSISEKVTD